MSVTAAIRKMLADGFTIGQALAAAEAFEAAMTPQRTARQDRNARYYQNKKATKASEKRLKASGSSYSDESVLNQTPSREPVRVEDNLQTKEITKQEESKKKTAREDLAEFESELSSLLDSDRIQALIAVRKLKRGTITGHAARLLIAKIRDCGLTPIEAADTMVLRNWISIEADWLRNSMPQNRATAPPPKQAHNEILDAIIRGETSVPANTIDTSFERTDSGGAPGLVRLYALPSGRR